MAIPKLAVTAGLMIAQVALGMLRKIEGPRQDELKVTLAEYGTPLPRFWGIRRFECPVIWAEELREEKKTSKTKGGKYSEYQYFGTWAVAVADQQIDAFARIWLDRHLVLQLTGTGPISAIWARIQGEEGDIKLSKGKNLAFYLGSETQLPDPRMEAWCEDRYSVPDSCPAYRGTAYIVFKDVPLDKFANRIPQVSVEAISVKSDFFPEEDFSTAASNVLDGFSFSPDFTRYLTYGADDSFEIWDVPSRTRIIPGTFSSTMASNPMGITNDGTIWGISNYLVNPQLRRASPDGVAQLGADIPIPYATNGIVVLDNTIFLLPVAMNAVMYHLAGSDMVVAEVVSFKPTFFFQDIDDNYFAVGIDGTDIYIWVDGAEHSFGSPTNSTSAVGAVDNGTHYVFAQDDRLYKVDKATFTVTQTSAALGVNTFSRSWFFLRSGSTTVWSGLTEISLESLTVLRSLTYTQFGLPAMVYESIYDPINHALISHVLGDDANVYWLYVDRVSSNGVTLGEIVEDVGGFCNLPIDAAELDQLIPGYSVTQASGRDWISPLLDIHHSILRPHDFGIYGIKHSTTALDTITTAEFIREGNDKRYVTDEIQDADLPLEITVNFADKDFDQQANNVISRRSPDAVDSTRTQSIDMTTYADAATDMQHKADRFMRWLWNTRWSVENAIPAQYLAVEPGDVYDIELDGIVWTAEVETAVFAATTPRIDCKWRRVFPSLVNLGSADGPEMGGRDPEVIFVPSPTKGFVLDIPLVEDADNNANPVLYYGAGGYGVGNWPGASVWEGDPAGEEYVEDWAAVTSVNQAEWGYTTNTLGDVESPWLWDRGNSVNIMLKNGTLTTVTAAEIDDDPTLNLAALYNPNTKTTELFNFTTATLEGDGTYTLSGFKRGRRGTEWATGNHAQGDEFILVSSLASGGRGVSDVGTTLYFKPQSFGRDPDFAFPISIEPYTGASLKPYAPSYVRWTYDGTDLTGTIIRRTRIGGAWVGGSTIPLGENSEAYEVDVYSGSTFKRTISATGTNVFTYTGAQASADGITLPLGATFEVYQMSDAVGRGYALAA